MAARISETRAVFGGEWRPVFHVRSDVLFLELFFGVSSCAKHYAVPLLTYHDGRLSFLWGFGRCY